MSSPRITPASLGKLPIALTLPDELWIKILLELDYFEVKKMRRVCKKLQRFTQDRKLDKALFRSAPLSPSLMKGHELELHPALECTPCIVWDFEKHKIYGKKKSFFVKDFPGLLDEHATSPATSTIQIYMPAPGRPNRLDRQSGVTVGEVLKELGRYWNSDPRDDLFGPNAHLYETTVSVLGDRTGCGIGGWKRCLAEGTNSTTLSLVKHT